MKTGQAGRLEVRILEGGDCLSGVAGRAHREVVRRSREVARAEQQSSQNTNMSPIFSSLASLETPPSKRSPFDDAHKQAIIAPFTRNPMLPAPSVGSK